MNLSIASADELAKLENITPDVVTAIVNWRGSDSTTGVAEAEYYAGLKPPYQPRNGPFQTVRELLMVRNVTPELFWGRDIHQNGMLPPEKEKAGSVDSSDLGWAGILTVDSTVQNLNAAGEDRINIQTADENSLAGISGVTPQIARAIVAYRGQHRFEASPICWMSPPPQSQNQSRSQNGFRAANTSNQSGGQVVDENLFSDIADDVKNGKKSEPAGCDQHQHRRAGSADLSAGRDPRNCAGHHLPAAVQWVFCQYRRTVKSARIEPGHLQADRPARDGTVGNLPHFERRES
ncbi:MAG: hypothetical protein WDN00_02065 [Limisphaerales bacterium]